MKSGLRIFAALCSTIGILASIAAPLPAATMDAGDTYDIGLEAWLYFYPLVAMDVTRRAMTNVPPGVKPGAGPMNQFTHFRTFPGVEFREVARPNFDTLYSLSWLDLTKEPIIVSAPDTRGRYYQLPILDMWSDVFAVPGKRATGTGAGDFAVLPPAWTGQIPAGVEVIHSPTPYVWIIGRTQTNGPTDYEAVHKIQDGYRLTPLSHWGKAPASVAFTPDPSVDMKRPPMEQVNAMDARAYFTYAAELMKLHPPHITDWSMVARLRRIGIEPGKTFEWEKADPTVREALTRAAASGLKVLYAQAPRIARSANGWQMNTDSIGVYGNYYVKRAVIALIGLGANPAEEAVYPLNVADDNGQPPIGENRYVLHFERDQLPPVTAFWSLTMYDSTGFPVPNPMNRYAIGDRDELKYNTDGSLDLYVQCEKPAPDKESNWLPAPAKGRLGLTLRLYGPKLQVLGGRWVPPLLQHLGEHPDTLPK